MIGRKRYAMSIYEDSIFMTGGVDANSTMLADFARFDINRTRWVHLDIANTGINSSAFMNGLAKMKPEISESVKKAEEQANK
jgi:hypothetical protein